MAKNVDQTHLVLAKDKLVIQEERNMNHDFLNESEPARPKVGQTQANEKQSLLLKPPIQVH